MNRCLARWFKPRYFKGNIRGRCSLLHDAVKELQLLHPACPPKPRRAKAEGCRRVKACDLVSRTDSAKTRGGLRVSGGRRSAKGVSFALLYRRQIGLLTKKLAYSQPKHFSNPFWSVKRLSPVFTAAEVAACSGTPSGSSACPADPPRWSSRRPRRSCRARLQRGA